MEWSDIKGKIYVDARYINNVDEAEKYPHEVWGDIFLGFRICHDDGTQTRITNEMMDELGATIEDLEIETTLTLIDNPPIVSTIEEMVYTDPAMRETHYVGIPDTGEFIKNGDTFVLTNMSGRFGASVMCNDWVMRWIGDMMEQSFFILPSSIHEVLLCRVYPGVEPQELVKMVTDINNTEVLPEDRLSYSVFKFDYETETISRVSADNPEFDFGGEVFEGFGYDWSEDDYHDWDTDDYDFDEDLLLPFSEIFEGGDEE